MPGEKTKDTGLGMPQSFPQEPDTHSEAMDQVTSTFFLLLRNSETYWISYYSVRNKYLLFFYFHSNLFILWFIAGKQILLSLKCNESYYDFLDEDI